MYDDLTEEIALPLSDLSCKWKDFSVISIFKSLKKNSKSSYNPEDAVIYDIKSCSTLCNSEFTIRFLKSCFSIFSSLPSSLNELEALEFSKRYRIALIACSNEIDSFIELQTPKDPNEQSEEQIEKIKYLTSTSQTFSFYELIWYLAEIIFIAKEHPGNISQSLMNWVNSQSNLIILRAKEILQDNNGSEIDIERLWDSVLSLLIHNDITNVIALLELHPKSNYPEFRNLRHFLGNMPDYMNENGEINSNLEQEWTFWQNECKNQFSLDVKKSADSEEDIDECYIRIIGSILSGSDYIWHHPLVVETLGDSSFWYIRFIGKLFFCNRFIHSKDIAYELSEWNRTSQDQGCGDDEIPLTKRIIESILNKDLTDFLNLCSGQFNCWWIPVHFLHILTSQKSWILKRNSKTGFFDMLDLMIIGFVDSIISTSDYTLNPISLGYLDSISKRKRHDLALINQVKARQSKILEKVKLTSNRLTNYVNLIRSKRHLQSEIELIVKNDLIQIPHTTHEQVANHSEMLRRVLLVTSKLLSLPHSSFGLLDKLIQRALHFTANFLLETLQNEIDQTEKLENLTEMYEIMSTSLLKYFQKHSSELTPTCAFFVAHSRLVGHINSRDDIGSIQSLIQLLSYQAIVVPERLKTTLLAYMTLILTKVDEENNYIVPLEYDQIQAILSIVPYDDGSRDLNFSLTKRLSELNITIK